MTKRTRDAATQFRNSPVFTDLVGRTLIIIPAYNEEESLESTIDELLSVFPACHYLIVNDGSSDKTRSICQQRGFSYLDLPVNIGLAGAFQAGIKFAFAHNYRYVVQFDADGQHDPRYLSSLLSKACDHDIVIGSRFLTQKKPLSLRMVGSTFITAAIRATTGTHIKDPTSGMRLFGPLAIKTFAADMNCGPEPDTVSYLLKRKKASVIEVPVAMRERTAGSSYLDAKAAIRYMLRMAISIVCIQPFKK